MPILDWFVGTPRPGQVRVLQEIERTWGRTDVFVIRADVGEGKSKIAECVIRWAAAKRGGAAGRGLIGVPTNVLLDQYLASTKGLDTLRARDLYRCHRGGTCVDRAAEAGRHCQSASSNAYARDACPYVRDLRRARSAPKMVATYHAVLANRLESDVLVVDEAHNLRPFLRDQAAVHLWRHDYGWPSAIRSVDELVKWLSDGIPVEDHDEATDLAWTTATGSRPQHMIDFSTQEWRGQWRECVSLIPLDVPQTAFLTRPSKLVLMSATIGPIDVRALGLDRRRVTHIEAPSSIPVDRRPIIYCPIADMRYANRDGATRRMAEWIRHDLLPAHAGERGLIHATYEVASALRRDAPERLVFHGRGDRAARLQEFLDIRPGDDRVFVASGMHEGLDLPGDLARFQLITAIPRPNIQDPATCWLAENRPEEYEWEAVRSLVQAAGRVCRGPDDFGITYIADSSFGEREMHSSQLPQSFRDSLVTKPQL